MKITCGNCRKSFNLPEEKLPAGKVVAFPCPDCSTRIELDLRNGSSSAAAEPSVPDKSVAGGIDEGAPTPGDQETIEELKKRIMRNLNELPPMPQIVFKAHEIMENPISNTKNVADLIETDQAIAAKVLKMANSAYYGMSGKVSSIQHASVVLGYKALGELITLAGTSSLLGDKLFGYGMGSGDLWRHSLTVAFASKILAQMKQPSLEHDAFSAGLIHDVGKLILDRPVLNRKKLFDEFMENGDRTFLSAERKILGFDHAEIGYEICQTWKIPESLAIAIRFHHRPGDSRQNGLVYIVCIANTIANMAEAMESMVGDIENGIDAVQYMLDDESLSALGLEEKDIKIVMRETLESVDKINQQMQPK